jgi:hypothetical protein
VKIKKNKLPLLGISLIRTKKEEINNNRRAKVRKVRIRARIRKTNKKRYPNKREVPFLEANIRS